MDFAGQFFEINSKIRKVTFPSKNVALGKIPASEEPESLKQFASSFWFFVVFLFVVSRGDFILNLL